MMITKIESLNKTIGRTGQMKKGLLITISIIAMISLVGCAGADGSGGAQGIQGIQGPAGAAGAAGAADDEDDDEVSASSPPQATTRTISIEATSNPASIPDLRSIFILIKFSSNTYPPEIQWTCLFFR